MSKTRYVVVGGGSAGMIASSYIKQYWNDQVDVTVVYDHKNPGIGVGESLTPQIYNYLIYVGITREDMIKHTNATVKLGLKFKNWLNDNEYFYHSFQPYTPHNNYPLELAYETSFNISDGDTTFGSYFFETNKIPIDFKPGTQSLHIDAVLFGRYIESKFKDRLNIVDGIVNDINENENGITSIVLNDGRIIEGDFFIDASGFQSVLFKKMNPKWVNMKDWLPLDKCIPNPLPWEFKEQPVCTTSEATEDGWILQVPLSNRWGTGYLYCSDYLSDEMAFEKFEHFLNKNYNSSLNNTSRVLNFTSGYWENQWIKNCICIGLSSGFAEPLEATNIHHTVYQVMKLVNLFDNPKKDFNYVRNYYNKNMRKFYDNVYQYLRFCYTTGRNDSEFWKYMSNSTPQIVKDIESLVINGIMTPEKFENDIFSHMNFTRVAIGLKKVDRNKWKEELISRNLLDDSHIAWSELQKKKLNDTSNSISHLSYVKNIRSF